MSTSSSYSRFWSCAFSLVAFFIRGLGSGDAEATAILLVLSFLSSADEQAKSQCAAGGIPPRRDKAREQ